MPSSFTHLFEVAKSGLIMRMFDLDSVSHNLSNVNTPGFKQMRVNFQELVAENQLNGSQISSTQRDMQQGAVKSTEYPYDLSIHGEGFFGVRLPDDRIAYTRAGDFHLDAENNLVTGDGYPLLWDGEIPEDASGITLNADGTIYAKTGVNELVATGRISLYRFPNPSGMGGFGENLWLETDASGPAIEGEPNQDGFGRIVNFELEISNVDLAEQATKMVMLQRDFDITIKTLQQSDQMMAQAIRLRQI